MQSSTAFAFFFNFRYIFRDAIMVLHQHLRGVLMYFAEEVRYFRMNRDALQELLTQNDLLPDHARSHVVVALAESTWFSAQFPLV